MSELHPSADRLLRAALDVLWAQWTALGAAGVHASRSSMIDPEALVVAAAEFGRRDPRLFDEMMDWLVVNAGLVDLVRLKRMVATEPLAARRLIGAIGESVAANGGRRPWKELAGLSQTTPVPAAAAPSQALFVTPSEGAGGSGTWGAIDPVFLAHGFVRNPPILRGMSQRPDAASPQCVRFRARALTGVSARAEVLTYLWTHEWAHGRLVAERAFYTKSVVALYLSDLSAAKLVSRRDEGRRIRYRLEPRLAAVGQPAAPYVEWAAVWRGIGAVWRGMQDWPAVGEVEHSRLSRLASILVKAAPDLGAEGFDVHVPEMSGWAATDGDLPIVVANRVAERLSEFVA
jgi:hypothetical protein